MVTINKKIEVDNDDLTLAISKEFLISRLGVEANEENIRLFANYITVFESEINTSQC